MFLRLDENIFACQQQLLFGYKWISLFHRCLICILGIAQVLKDMNEV